MQETPQFYVNYNPNITYKIRRCIIQSLFTFVLSKLRRLFRNSKGTKSYGGVYFMVDVTWFRKAFAYIFVGWSILWINSKPLYKTIVMYEFYKFVYRWLKIACSKVFLWLNNIRWAYHIWQSDIFCSIWSSKKYLSSKSFRERVSALHSPSRRLKWNFQDKYMR